MKIILELTLGLGIIEEEAGLIYFFSVLRTSVMAIETYFILEMRHEIKRR